MNENEIPAILLVDDEPDFLSGLARIISREIPCTIITAQNGSEALRKLEENVVDVVLTDVRMPGVDGIGLLERIKAADPWTTVIVMTAYGTIDLAVEAIKKGAYDFLEKPFKPKQVHHLVHKALEHNGLIRENILLRCRLSHLGASCSLLGGGPVIRRVLAAIRTVAALNVTVLLRGESGTGKDLAARQIHMLSPRANRPMATINCPTIPESLLESELFGYAKGAFTGAESDKKGLVEEASGSTLYLDEIGDISPTIQTKLLRVIQEKEIKPLGRAQGKLVDVRIIASTNQDLEAKIATKTFREDLFYRLNVVTIRMPALREIAEEIPLLTAHFMKQAVAEFQVEPRSISPEAMRYLMEQPWPGNVRQLRNSVHTAMIFGQGPSLQIHDFLDSRGDFGDPGENRDTRCAPYRHARDALVADFTVRYIREALCRNTGNVSAAARDSGLERQHFQQLMKKHGISAESFRDTA